MIEPAVSIERIFVAMLVDAYDEEVVADRDRTVAPPAPAVAPVKAAILPLISKNDGDGVEVACALRRSCASAALVEYDDSGQIGRRYRRQDEIGTPWAFTIDDQTLEDDTVTVRDRDSLAQERLPISGVAAVARRRPRAAVGLTEGMRPRSLSRRCSFSPSALAACGGTKTVTTTTDGHADDGRSP